ncbi:MAG: hypothetical protein ACI9T7_001871 [Oleiphilaceae bacterium]|jgi:hypothetical protein
MSYKAEFTGWNNLAVEDLLVAYRKAKADCFFENTFPTASKFAEYELDLLANLKKLMSSLKDNKGFTLNKEYLGKFRIIPKKLAMDPKAKCGNGHVHFSSPARAFGHLKQNTELKPEFRVIGDFPVESHIISALWINMVGHKLDSCLSERCYGARLKRISNDDEFNSDKSKPFHLSSTGSFVPYFQPYQKWRNDGLQAIRGELEKDRDVIAVSLDLKSYYHFIDPSALSLSSRHESLNIELSEEELIFTDELAKFMSTWSDEAKKFVKKTTKSMSDIDGGLAIGLTASRIVSNILLFHWDSLIKQKIAPIHYGRYVDDMFLVMHDTGNISSSHDFMLFLQDRLGKEIVFTEASRIKGNAKQNDVNESVWNIQQGKEIQGDSLIQLQANKQKLFILQGRGGLDLLDSIEKEISELSSEHRLMPSPDQLEDSTAAKVLSAASGAGEHADTLRRADGLTIRRLSWSLQLRHVETLAKDLPSHEWSSQREEFYQFAFNHILRPDRLFEHFSYLPRLLGFAISMNEWRQAELIVHKAYDAINQLADEVPFGKPVAINGRDSKAGKQLWRYVKGTLTWYFVDAATRYYDPNKLLSDNVSNKEKRLSALFLKGILGELTDLNDILDLQLGSDEFYHKAPLVALADLANEPYKQILKSESAKNLLAKHDKKRESQILKVFESANLIDVEALKEFRNSTTATRLEAIPKGERKGESFLPYLFPTRPLSPLQISELAPECIGLGRSDNKLYSEKPSYLWARYTQALRGVWVKPTLLASQQDNNEIKPVKRSHRYLMIGTDTKQKVVVALTNIKTDDKDWSAMASGKPNLSKERYRRISELVNQTLSLTPKPDYMLFPELSLPLEWVNSVSARLSAAGISLIAGTEYRHSDDNKILSEACLVLSDNRLGYPASVIIRQPKLRPAINEDRELISIYGKTWAITESEAKKRPKPVYIHNGAYFGVMVCSELQNSISRVKFQGVVDALMVLSWNQDLETFASLIESAALDVHAYTILVNNRTYGDSRVRAPAKESFMRDLARVRGGDNDFVIAATLDLDSLRAFQSRAKRWPQVDDKFKPVPEGFKLLAERRKAPK